MTKAMLALGALALLLICMAGCGMGALGAGGSGDIQITTAEMRLIAKMDLESEGILYFYEAAEGDILMLSTLSGGRQQSLLSSPDFPEKFREVTGEPPPAEILAMNNTLTAKKENGGGAGSLPASLEEDDAPEIFNSPASRNSGGGYVDYTGVLNRQQFLDWIGFYTNRACWAIPEYTRDFYWKGKCTYISALVNVVTGSVYYKFRVRHTPLFKKNYWQTIIHGPVRNDGITLGAWYFSQNRRETDFRISETTGMYHLGGVFMD